MNLFLVTSPFQYICANEARHQYQTFKNILVIIEQDSEPGITQQQKTVNPDDWDYVIRVERKNRSKNIPLTIQKIKKILNNESIDNFFHGEYKSWRTKLMLRNLPVIKEVYFDDGTLTINEYEESIRPKTVYHRSRFIQDLTIRLRGCKPIGKMEQSNNFEIFTIFDIPNPEHKIVKNTLSKLKDKYNSETLYNKDSPLGFIGQGAIGHKRRKTIDAYEEEIKFFIKEHKKSILYFPHRTESSEVRERLSKIEGLEYHICELPLELEILDKQIYLSGLIGILSTAQYTALMLYPNMPIFNLVNNKQSSDFLLTDIVQKREERILEMFNRSRIVNINIS
jgi:hypothetical protein